MQFLHSIQAADKAKLQALLKEYASLTDPSIAKITNIQARLILKKEVNPVFLKPRSVPFRMRTQVEEELDRLTQDGILEKVNHSDWATPIVPVLKKNGSLSICGDYSVTLNPRLRVDEHPLPTPDELLASMAGGKVFSKIDLLQAYLQLEIRPEDRELLTLNTHKGLYRPTRLMYGVASAPAIWQRTIENILKDIPGVAVFLDDIRVAGSSEKDHFEKLRIIFDRLQKYNIRINTEKSEFLTDKINYCGYVIDQNGIHKAQDKIDAIQNMRKPSNITELRSFLGMIHYYERFSPNLSTILQPLNRLLQKNTRFIWSPQCEKSFQEAKQIFTSPRCLIHFDSRLPVTLATDASPYSVGAVLSHILPDGSERAIQYASKTLSKTQQKYSQIDKEALAIIFGIKKFYQYLQGSKFTLITDHRPLTQIFSPTKSLPMFTASRMQHYALFLQGFNYDIRYRKSELHANADCLSRLPIPSTELYDCDPIDIFQESTFDTLPITAQQVANATVRDKELSKLLNYLQSGKSTCKEQKFHSIPLSEFTLFQGVIFRGYRVVIPMTLQKEILRELHSGHFGIVRMKHLARSYVWWNQIDKDIEKVAKNCYNCNTYRNDPPKVTNHIWEPTSSPFERIHVDFAGPFLGHNFFILIDAHTKWPEIHTVKNITSETTIKLCRQIFATYGIPQYLVSDNAKTFTSKEFSNFLKVNGITHRLTAPYHPATNGQAERYVQTLKNALKRMQATPINVQVALQQLLIQYRNTTHTVTGKSPAEAMFSRKIRTRLDILRPIVTKHSLQNAPPLKFTEGERVSCRNYQGKEKWLFGRIKERLGNLHYQVQLDDGRTWKRHVNQLRPIGEDTPKRIKDCTQLDSYNNLDISRDNVTASDTNASDTLRNESMDGVPLTPSPPRSLLTTPEASTSATLTASQFSTPTEFFLTSTPKPSVSSNNEAATPTGKQLRPQRTNKLPAYLRDYVVPKKLE